ncbi:hypothetical protein [Turneriella parva]|uniref:Uncharacterized protein n=1 Tax=Turneriella parva (strain ATCC BAA-1111 / DSM 21527 / NCTC 11395 / H) TaxID=869212 RepID=I4B1M8_TURPD|nr:hypothetical protein [Turneriella parva]AFM11185.1 hypothetical protein Turpa_0531 [Turneriella parva DSM 21527]
MNVKFTYLYRDAGNYKTWYDVVFPNRTGKTAEQLTEEIKKHLISGQYFDKALAPLPIEPEHDFDEELDYTWLEFHSLRETPESSTSSQDIEDFIASLGANLA